MAVKVRYFREASARCKLVDWGNGRATVSDLYATERRQGHARALLTHICEWADRKGTTLIITAGPYGDDPKPTVEELLVFYESLGFEQLIKGSKVHTYMERKPRKINTAYNEKKE